MLVLGAGSGVGLAAVDIGSALGLRVIAAASTPEKRARAVSRGAMATIDNSTLDDWVPHYQRSGAAGDGSGVLLGCDALRHPAEFSGFSIVLQVA